LYIKHVIDQPFAFWHSVGDSSQHHRIHDKVAAPEKAKDCRKQYRTWLKCLPKGA
jgi:hypothetical protein